MRFFLELTKVLAQMPDSMKLSAFALLLFFFVVWQATQNKAVMRVVDRSLNVRLAQGDLYNLLKRMALLIFLFSLVFITLVMLSPALYKYLSALEKESAGRAAGNAEVAYAQTFKALRERGKRELHLGHYDLSRATLTAALSKGADEPTREYIDGLIISTYYGPGLYREGLDYICDLYRGRAALDHRYRFQIHAMLRKIALTENLAKAENVAQSYRTRCGRTDFSEFWASIPLAYMESMHESVLHDDWPGRLRDEDEKRLIQLLKNKEAAAVSGRVDFGDYALYVLGQYEDALNKYPHSDLTDGLLLDAAQRAEWPDNAKYFQRYLKEFPHAAPERRHQVQGALATVYSAHGMSKEAFDLLAPMTSSARQSAVDALLDDTARAVNKLADSGDFRSAYKVASVNCAQFKSQTAVGCGELAGHVERLSFIASLPRPTTSQQCMRIFLAARSRLYFFGARAVLDGCLEKFRTNTLEYGRALYLLASASRQLNDYGASLKYLQRFKSDISSHPLLDDVYTELGWHYSFVDINWKKAQEYLTVVVKNFPGGNAYDDALWWLAYGARKQGNYSSAMSYYTTILTRLARSRFKSSAAEEIADIGALNGVAPLSGLSFGYSKDNSSDVAVRYVAAGSFAQQLGVRQGDKVVQICGHEAGSLDGIPALVESADTQSNCSIVFKRGTKLREYIGRGPKPAGWHQGQKTV